jgi:hypothetical protein
MHPVGFKPTISAEERPQTYALDRAATGTGIIIIIKVIPVIIGATGTISKSLRKYGSDIPGNRDVKELQKTAILGTAHILRKVLT